MNNTQRLTLPRITARAYVPMRPDADGVLTTACVRQARWHSLVQGCSVRISVYGLRAIGAGSAELIGRHLVDAQVDDVEIQASAHPALVMQLRSDVTRAARAYLKVLEQG